MRYYNLTAPFAGVVGDIPVHIGDYVSPQTLLTTVDENAELEAYIYIPTERSHDIRMGLPVQIVTSSGELIESTKIDFVSQQVDNALQGILVKAPVHSSLDRFRNAQLVKARVVWSTVQRRPFRCWPSLASAANPSSMSRPKSTAAWSPNSASITLGDTVGNDYAVTGRA